jgi:hypothetical protein
VYYTTRDFSPTQPLTQLQKIFDEFASSGQLTIHCSFGPTIKGLEVLYADDANPLHNVWKGEHRLLLEFKKDRAIPIPKKFVPKDQDAPPASAEANARIAVNASATRYEWKELKNGASGDVIPAPPPFEIFEWKATNFEPFDFFDYFNTRLAQAEAANIVLLGGNPQSGGLWKAVNRGKPELIMSRGFYTSPIITPDAKWAIAAKRETNGEIPKQVVRIDLETNKEYVLNVPPAKNLDIVSYLASLKAVLLYRIENDNQHVHDGESPESTEFYLVDPVTGTLARVQGDFRPLLQWGDRLLQQSWQAGKVWAAIPDSNGTQIGLYDTGGFSFRSIMSIPRIQFHSRDMWIDEEAGKIYLVYLGRLLRLPITMPDGFQTKIAYIH